MASVQSVSRIQPELVERWNAARARSDELFALLPVEALYDRPIPERHRLIFYVGHLEAFDWNLLRERALGLSEFHPEFDRLFAFGIDPVDAGLPSDRAEDWPSPAEVRGYVRAVRDRLDDAASRALVSDSQSSPEFPLELLLNVAIEHRLMHVETLAYMFHQLPGERKHRPQPKPEPAAPVAVPAMVKIPAGIASLGKRRSSGTFGWDNEFEAVLVEVPAFAIDKYMVTNRQYLEFVAAGGYDSPEYWSPADWGWKAESRITHPVFWKQCDETWRYRSMFEEIPLPPEWPVYVSHAEASAYARWSGKALPTEAEWHRAAYCSPGGAEREYPWGPERPTAGRGNFDLQRWNPTPVGAFPQGESGFGVSDMLGNGWEWTSTQFVPFAGFEPFPFYRGYSADFFDGKHYVIKGGSPRTAACMLRRSFRNWFQPHYQYVYAGFRCVSRNGI